MLSGKSILAAAAALALFCRVEATTPAQPSCSSYTPFKYAGCFQDQSVPTTALIYRSNLPSTGMTIEICTSFCKGNNYQYAGLEYYGECFCGASVNGPQVDESFCNLPCDGDHTETCGGNDYVSVYQDPTFPVDDTTTIVDYMPMGCYTDLSSTGRTLPWQQNQLNSTTLTIEECLYACKDGGYSFAGLEYAKECWCGVVLGNGTTSVDNSQCNMACTGNANENCGGSSLLNLFVAKDIESTEPCNGGSPPSSSSTSSSPASSTTTSSSSSSSTSTSTSTTSSSSTSTTSSSSTSTTSTSSTTSSCTTTSSSTSSTLSTTTTTKTSASLCTSTKVTSPTPTCEYSCGNWCSTPIPDFSDSKSCLTAVSACSIQVASCFLKAGFPASLNCFQFGSWCQNVNTYCSGYCPGGSCSASKCRSKYPPSGYSAPSSTVSTITYTCSATPAASTTSTSTTTSCSTVPVPTASNICTQPSNPNKGYSSSSPVGGITLPCLTCNNLYSDYQSNPFKLYTSSDSSQCKSYKKGSSGSGTVYQGCKDACDAQYNSCISTYAQGCKSATGKGSGDTYNSASTKCSNQQQDCYWANSGVSGSGRCSGWNSGWTK